MTKFVPASMSKAVRSAVLILDPGSVGSAWVVLTTPDWMPLNRRPQRQQRLPADIERLAAGQPSVHGTVSGWGPSQSLEDSRPVSVSPVISCSSRNRSGRSRFARWNRLMA